MTEYQIKWRDHWHFDVAKDGLPWLSNVDHSLYGLAVSSLEYAASLVVGTRPRPTFMAWLSLVFRG